MKQVTLRAGVGDNGMVIEEMQAEARSLLSDGEYVHALAEFSVLREIRSRREGPYSPMYLSNLHDCVRCMSALQQWADATPLCAELHGKYVRTHGRGAADTVDVAKHWAWSLLHLDDTAPAVRIYLLTADALWAQHHDQAQQLLGAAFVHGCGHGHEQDPESLVAVGAVEGVALRNRIDMLAALTSLRAQNPPLADARTRTTIDGLCVQPIRRTLRADPVHE